MTYRSTKTFSRDLGWSCAFRQWRATSNCKYLHGYALEVGLVFEAETLDERNWVQDFGGLRSIKTKLEYLLDHKTLVAEDDPHLDWFQEACKRGILHLMIVKNTGCEAVAELVYNTVTSWLAAEDPTNRVRLVSAEVREHGANSALYLGPK